MNDGLFIRVGQKGELSLATISDTTKLQKDYYGLETVFFEIIWSDWSVNPDNLPIGATGVVSKKDIIEMLEEGMLFEVT